MQWAGCPCDSLLQFPYLAPALPHLPIQSQSQQLPIHPPATYQCWEREPMTRYNLSKHTLSLVMETTAESCPSWRHWARVCCHCCHCLGKESLGAHIPSSYPNTNYIPTVISAKADLEASAFQPWEVMPFQVILHLEMLATEIDK